MDEANFYRVIASKMDIKDIMDVLNPHHVEPLASRNEEMSGMETDTDSDHDSTSPREQPAKHGPLRSLVCDVIHPNVFLLGTDHMDTEETHANVTPIGVPHTPILSPLGTPTSRVGFPSKRVHLVL
jgi:hypothetical protein